MRARLATLILAAGVSLGGCAYGGGYGGLSVGTGYGSPYGYGGYGGYGSPYGGYGAGYGYSPYGRYNPYYRSPYYGSPYYGSPYLGWYDGYYYPGRGYYVYDRDRVRRRITEAERQRWLQGIAEAAAVTARDGQAGSSTTTQTRVIRRNDSAVSRIRDLARSRTEARSGERSTSRSTPRSTSTSRSTSRSSDLRSTIRSRVRASQD